ncbi:MAG: CapA family protein [Melioribacteraceae bacterium]
MKNLSILFILTILSSRLLFYTETASKKDEIIPDSLQTITLSFVGDLMCHTPQMEYSRTAQDSFDFTPSFREVKNKLSEADLTIGNLETTISGKEERYSGYPLFNSPDEYLSALKESGFDILITANNHTIDRGTKGALRTIEKIKQFGMESVGTFNSSKNRDSIRIVEIKGIRLAFLAYTYGLNGNFLPQKEKFLVNLIDTNLIKSDIARARSGDADVILVYFHFGTENRRMPDMYQRQVVQFTIESGADLIIGSHPHVIQPVEYFTSTKNRIGKGIVAYSLGNFISNQRWRFSDAGVILTISLSKYLPKGEVKLNGITFQPTWVYKGEMGNRKEFLVLPADSSASKRYSMLNEKDRFKMNQASNDLLKVFKKISLGYLNEMNN